MASRLSVFVVVAFLVGATVGAGVTTLSSQNADTLLESTTNDTDETETRSVRFVGASGNATVERFDGRADFRAYVQRGQRLADGGTGFTSIARTDVVLEDDAVAMDSASTAAVEGSASEPTAPDRVSETNVQEQGLDEPDILKNDGENVFYAPLDVEDRYWGAPVREDGDETHVVSASDPAEPEVIADIDTNGRMLLSNDTLVVIEDEQLRGYDVSDAENPERNWTVALNHSVVTARLYDGRMYLVTREEISLSDPCPVEPLGGETDVACTDVYHPSDPAPVDSTYTAIALDPESGAVDSTTSFVGTNDDTAVYMSEHGLYVTYTQRSDRGELRIDYLLENQSDRLPTWVEDRLEEIRGYNISSTSKRSEADRVLEQWYQSLEEDEREEVRSEISNDYRDYLGDHQRDLVRTGVVRIGVGADDLAVENVSTVPGEPLNQFSMDEYDGTLRITTTVPAAGDEQSENDLYVLDNETLDRKGSEQGMGVSEEVYSVRYVEETAYVVTFRRIDPFHVVDLSDPSDPEEVGELELPGFSSYLHPIDENHVLGIGEEDGEVKAVLFDVSDPSDPTIDDDYVLDSDWSAVSNSHHAFLIDRKHGVFFLPTGEGGKVFDYTDGELDLETTVETEETALRAMYVDDYMYVLGEEELVVVDETTWDETETVSFD
jgi:uncharacterized secreted protein with C-terminal beta-propeller domain